ncbi:LicD family protein [Butyrivibrio sp. INlla21]|uniref:LicD family protein n=1 Tax=Butyrivibrio sp. INlla21 TaxID=1520811 RepID=UPI0008F0D90C|nr:LicD family protein [Butyrivibrio sp. INlla21]SFU66015.1 Phosphorylcholine metabolism protein LicD [Butyrivibrio sp. INlla21]
MNTNPDEEMKMMPLEEISFPLSFFREEVRNGFYIPTMIKRYWAGQLQILSEIAKLCKKHDIQWFGDYGTMLGAVRHGGYIPWDDDFDICMMRDDYERFFEIAKKEFPKEYIILSLRDIEEGYDNILGRIVNCSAIDCTKEHMDEFSGCPYTVGVDIFPMDGMFADETKEKERYDRAKRAILVHNAVEAKDELGDLAKNIESLLIDVEKENHVHLKRGKKLKRELELLIEKIYMECPVSDGDRVALMPFYMMYGNHVFPKKFFEKTFEMKFENTTIQIPCCYDQILSSNYGNYMEIRKGGGMHEYPCYISQERALKKKLEHNPYRYTFDANHMLVSVKRYMTKMLAPAPAKEKETIVFLPCRAMWWETMEGLWHQYKAEGHDVHVYPINFYDCDYYGNVGEMHDERALFPDYVGVENCEELDFAQIRPDKIVIQVPCDAENTALTVHEFFYSSNLINFTDELVYVPCFDIDDPIDRDDKACRGIEILAEQPAVVYADKVLLKSEKQRELYLEKLISLSGEETRAFWEQKIEVSPYVGSDWKKRGAQSAGAGRAHGAGSASPVEIEHEREWREFLGDYADRKAVIYYFTISTVIYHGEKAIDKFERVLETFAGVSGVGDTAREGAADQGGMGNRSADGDSENAGAGVRGKIVAIFVPQDYLTANLDKAEPAVRERYLAFIEKAKNTPGIIFDEAGRSLDFIDKWSAYYGDTGVAAMECASRKIPVMLENVEV